MNLNTLIEEYYSHTNKEKIKKYGQYFTPLNIAKYMSDWIFENDPKSVLDPAIGNNIFIGSRCSESRKYKGYDIDKEIVDFFKIKQNCDIEVVFEDYLLNGWSEKWDAIVANPPYNRFQNIDNKEQIREMFMKNLNMDLNGYANQYVLFLIKSLFELNDGGRLAYIIPTEFMNLEYGSIARRVLCENGYLAKIIIFDTQSNKSTLFNSAVTTSCIVLVEKKYHEYVSICNADYLEDSPLKVNEIVKIQNNELIKISNWKNIIKKDKFNSEKLVAFDKYIKVSRGIATGDNDYFIFNEEKRIKYSLSYKHFYPVICKAPFIDKPFFTEVEFNDIKNKNKDYLLFDGTLCEDIDNANYLKLGLDSGILNKYLVASRKVWYQSEKKEIAPIWLCGNSREKIKVVRNILGIRNLTTFHGVYIRDKYDYLTNIIFCYLLTDISQILFSKNKKEYAGGLNKFQPGDIQKSFCIDFDKIFDNDIVEINGIYEIIQRKNSILKSDVEQLNLIFKKYL